jgi:hypothetical protein
MSETRKVFDWVLSVRGVYGRNRSEKFKSVRLLRRGENETGPDDAALSAAVDAAFADINFKRGVWCVDRNPVELETYSDGATIEKFLLFSGQRVMAGVK